MHAFDVVESTMDVAHELAHGGAVHGTVILAETQSAGRGRERREWQSPRGGVWLTVLLRLVSAGALPVLPLRVGIASARALDPFAREPIALKWPNDLFLGEMKLGGVLVEARWRGGLLDWVAVGIGINSDVPVGVAAAALGGRVPRRAVVERLIPAVIEAVSREGELTAAELAEFAARDVARGRVISAPVAGLVIGINAGGALLVEREGATEAIRSGSVVFADNPQSLAANR